MIYTCYEMIRDCRAGLPEGWSYFVSSYVPVVRKLMAHYAADDPALLDRILLVLREPGSSLFQSIEPAPERWFLGELRQAVLAQLETAPAGIEIDLATVAAALQPLTLVEKQAAWFGTMRYDTASTGAMLRTAPATVEKIRRRAADLIRGAVDAWNQSLLADNGVALGRAAAAASGNGCLSAKAFLDVLDGRATWRGREELESHAATCWHCIDRFCRLMEVVGWLRDTRPLSDAEAAPYRKLLGIEAPRRPLWKRLTSGA